MTRTLALVLGAGALALVARPFAQQPAFRTDTRLVVLYATVRNDRGELVTDLGREAFTVYEDGRRQPIELFRRDDVPVSIGLLLDNSGSMRRKRASVEAAALAFVRASNPLDEAFVVNFADKVRIDVPMTSDISALEANIARVDSIGGTAMRDAVVVAQRYLTDHARHDRRVITIVTDGNDNASERSEAEIQRIAEVRGLTIDAIGLLNEGDEAQAGRARHELDRLTETSGGIAYYPKSIDGIGDAALDLARQIRNQYTIAYAQPAHGADGKFHRIKVVAKGPGRLEVRTRAGYR